NFAKMTAGDVIGYRMCAVTAGCHHADAKPQQPTQQKEDGRASPCRNPQPRFPSKSPEGGQRRTGEHAGGSRPDSSNHPADNGAEIFSGFGGCSFVGLGLVRIVAHGSAGRLAITVPWMPADRSWLSTNFSSLRLIILSCLTWFTTRTSFGLAVLPANFCAPSI